MGVFVLSYNMLTAIVSYTQNIVDIFGDEKDKKSVIILLSINIAVFCVIIFTVDSSEERNGV